MSGYNGAAVMLDPHNGEVLAFTSVPAYDPNAFAAGINRAAWASLNTDDFRPLQDRTIQGRYPAGLHVQDGGRRGGARRGDHHAGFQGELSRPRGVLRTELRLLAAERPRPRRRGPPARHRAFVQRVLLHDRQHGRASTRSTSGRRCSASAKKPASICRTKCRGWCRRPSGNAR